MAMRILALVLLMTTMFMANVYAAYEINEPNDYVSVSYGNLDGIKIKVNTSKEYVPFRIIIRDLPNGIFVLDWDNKDALVCGPTAYEITTSGDDITIYCIAKPATNTVDMKFVRYYANTTTTKTFTVEIQNVVVWYEVFSGGIESGYYITNGEYIIEHKPKQLVSQLIVKRGGELVFTGLLFPGQEEKISEDLKIKFLGAIDNVTYLKVYSTSDKKFSLVQIKPQVKIVERIKKVYPSCTIEDEQITIENAIATIFYEDGSQEIVNASETKVILKRPNVAAVVCGEIIKSKEEVEFGIIGIENQTQEQPQQPTVEQPRFLTLVKNIYYVGEPVTIMATAPFTITCTDGTSMETDTFTKVFNQPATCVVKLGENVKTIQIKPKEAQQPTPVQKTTEKFDKDTLLKIVAAGIIIYLLYRYKDEIMSRIKFRRKQEAPPQRSKEEEDIEYEVKSALEGEH